MNPYDHKTIEKKWQEKWEADGVYQTAENSDKPKQFVLDMFPYPSGDGLHVGHPRGYMATDVYSRMKRMQGFNVLHPMGWDAFGLPAENYAIKNKIHPRVAVEENIARFKKQLGLMGVDYDWSREINTTDPAFYKWTQWIFLQMYHKGLAYESWEPINWCPGCQTGLANEDVESDGTCERCGSKVEKKPMRQWVLKITEYADRMLLDLDKLPKWPEGVKEAQRNWIGKSEGAEIDFLMPGQPEHPIKIFTTRPDTIFGATFIAVSAGLAKEWFSVGWKAPQEIQDYVEKTLAEEAVKDFKEKEKTGIYAGFDAVNPASQQPVPVWITNYVMKDVGTGAIMGVPAHDERDFEFANKYNLSIKQVIVPGNKMKAVVVVPTLENDTLFKKELQKAGIGFALATSTISKREQIRVELTKENLQEFIDLVQKHITENNWVEIIGSENIVVKKDAVYKDFLNQADEWFKKFQEWEPLIQGQKNLWDMFSKNTFLNELVCYRESGNLVNSGKFDGMTSEEAQKAIVESVGGKMVSKYKLKDWVFSRQRYWGEPIPIIHCEKCGVVPVPEADLPVTLPEVESYAPTGTGESPLANISEWVNVPCPKCNEMAKRETNTMPQWAGSSWYYLRYIDPKNNAALVDKDKEKNWMDVDVYVGGDHATRHLIYARFWHKFLYDNGIVSTEEPFPRLEFLGFILAHDGQKMSKSKGNVISPDEVIAQFGADAFRLYQMFIGPFEQTAMWNANGMVGTLRFVEKVWRIAGKVADEASDLEVQKTLNKTIKKVSEDIEGFKFNTAVSAFMILANTMESATSVSKDDFKKFLQILAPFAPHSTEELWSGLHGEKSIHTSAWPRSDEKLITEDTVTIGIQVNGKVRAEIEIAHDATEAEVKEKVMNIPEVMKWIEGKEVKKFIFIPKKIISIVA